MLTSNHSNAHIRTAVIVWAVALVVCACPGLCSEADSDRAAVAERYFRGIYSGDMTVVDDLASADILISYPIIEELFGKGAIRGREAVKAFVNGFGKKWVAPQFEFHEVVSDGDNVVLIWSFRARDAGSSPAGQPATNEEHAWGGITWIRFDKTGKISMEIGEESSPGPMGRLEDVSKD